MVSKPLDKDFRLGQALEVGSQDLRICEHQSHWPALKASKSTVSTQKQRTNNASLLTINALPLLFRALILHVMMLSGLELLTGTFTFGGKQWDLNDLHVRTHARTHARMCMHVCVYACMHVCMYHVCMHACMHACMHVCMFAGMHVCMYVCTYACRHVCMYACMYRCMDV